MSSEKAYSGLTSIEEKTIRDLKQILKFEYYKVKDVYKILRKLKAKLSPAKRQIIRSHFTDIKREKPWTLRDIGYALALSKKGFKSYNFIRDCIPLPSRREIRSVTKNFEFNPGMNGQLLRTLRRRISRFFILGKTCSVFFQEIDLSEKAVFDKEIGETVGYVSLGSLGCKNELANRALVFMAKGINARWKQPIAYYFIRDTVDGPTLKHLLIEVIRALQIVGFKVLATVFDDRPLNQVLIEELCHDRKTNGSKNFFKLENEKIYCLYDPCHLLKSTRNALFEYNIEFENSKVAKWEVIQKTFEIDETRGERKYLSKINKEHIYLDQYPQSKDSVRVAATTLSLKMVSGIAMMVLMEKLSTPSIESEAIGTYKFVIDINYLFDTLNGSEFDRDEEEYRSPISSRSKHLKFWKEVLPKINSWVFISKDGKTRITDHPLKKAWVRTIEVTKELWKDCRRMGATSLPTRNLNMDPLHNLFISLCYFNPRNSNLNCHQFISCFKSLLLNNLKMPSTLLAYEDIDEEEEPARPLIHAQLYVKQEDVAESICFAETILDNAYSELGELYYMFLLNDLF